MADVLSENLLMYKLALLLLRNYWFYIKSLNYNIFPCKCCRKLVQIVCLIIFLHLAEESSNAITIFICYKENAFFMTLMLLKYFITLLEFLF